MAKANEIKYLTAIKADKRPKKYCRFKKMGIRYIDYKDGDFLKKFLNEQGKLLPRRLSCLHPVLVLPAFCLHFYPILNPNSYRDGTFSI